MTASFAQAQPDFSGNACQGHTAQDQKELWEAANRLVNARGFAINMTRWLSQHVQSATGNLEALGRRILGKNWDGLEDTIRASVETALSKAHDLATLGLEGKGEKDSWLWMNRILSSVSGAVSGFAGLPGLLLDVPVTTTLMLRSIAEIARSHGEDIASEEGRRACLEVLAQGGPRAGDDDAEIGYWSTRAGLSHLSIAALTRTVASRFGVQLSRTMLARMVPVAGALTGGGLNWVFMGYYHEMARVHFTLRAIERRTGDPAGVRVCFDRLVAQASALKKGETGVVIDA